MPNTKRLILSLALVVLAILIFYLGRPKTANPQDGAAPAAQTNAATSTLKSADAQPTGKDAARQFDSNVSPYAALLREPGKSKRGWDADYLQSLAGKEVGDAISFELTSGKVASGSIKVVQQNGDDLTFISGELTAPEAGKFFFLKPPADGKAGKAVGVVEFPASQTAYRVEPTGPDGEPELWQRRMDEVVCESIPLKKDRTGKPLTSEEAKEAEEREEMPPLRPDLVPTYVPTHNSNIVSLQSYPGSPAVLLLDFFGGYTPTWGGVTYPRPNVSNTQIRDLWKRVAEDYMPFNINVTTDLKVFEAAPAASRQRVVFTPSTSAVGSGAAGVAYIGSWNWGNDTVCWSIYTTGKSGAEVGSHEAGHTLGLGHQGTSTSGYYGGHGSGSVGWAPIMGAGYYEPVTTWAKGEYQDANNTEDELNKIVSQNNSVDYRADDTGSLLATSRHLELFTGSTASGEGVIETTGDTDAFQFTTSGGRVALAVTPVGDWANVGMTATLADTAGTVIASNNPQSSLSAAITNDVAAGTYTLRVTGASRNNPLSSGFTTYGSLGYYSITGSVAGARLPTRLTVREGATNATIVGTIPPPATNGNPLLYTIVSGNSNTTFAIDNSGVVTVANNALLNYEALAQNTDFPVQFVLFVNITDTMNPAFTELSRRVVIAVTNVNEAPSVTGFSARVLERTELGTVIGKVNGNDPDAYTVLRYSIVAGNTGNAFAIDTNTGTVTLSGTLDVATTPSYNLGVVVSDQTVPSPMVVTSTVPIIVVPNQSPFNPGSIGYAYYGGISNTSIPSLTNAASFPRDPTWATELTLLEAETDQGDNYGSAFRGFIIPPNTGTYTFWIASDDSSELWLSTTTNPANATLIASINGYSGVREWTKFASQQSVGISLVAGQAYYIEVRHKEGSGGDHLAVAWQNAAAGITRDVIPGRYLAPFHLNYVPRVPAFTYRLHKDAIFGSRVGTAAVSDQNTSDTHTFSIVSGNVDNVFGIEPTTGVVRVTNETALRATARSSYSLQVRVVDNGTPALSNTVTLSYTLYASNVVTTTAVRQEVWNNLGSGNAVADLTDNARFPRQPDELRSLGNFNSSVDFADNYGSRVRAYLTPSSSGAYTFFIASDDHSQLWLSSNDDPANAIQIASLSGSSDVNEWSYNASQKSAPVNLVAGQRYYIETRHKEGVGGDHLEVAWTGPGIATTNVIADSFISPFDLGHAPGMTNRTATVLASAANGTTLTTIPATDSSLDLIAYKIVSGNSNNTFAIDVDTGRIYVTNNAGLAASGGYFALGIQAQDSGYGGYFPLRSAFATVNVNVTGIAWPPSISLLQPLDGSSVAAPVTISASASDANNNLARVEFYGDGSKLGQLTTAPFTFTWTNVAPGLHTIHAVAIDTLSASATSAVVQVQVAPSAAVTMISTGAAWRYLDNGTDQGIAWRNTVFNDSAWKTGRAQLGYGDNDEATRVEDNATAGYVSTDTDRYITTYFRRAFYVHEPALIGSLTARVLRDDGAVAYLNGVEFFRNNMPAGGVSYTTLASGAASDDGATYFTTNINPDLLVAGTNVIAVEIHQAAASSTDLSFDLELKGIDIVTNLPPLEVTTSGNALLFAWPAHGDHFGLVTATNLTPPVTWTALTNAPALSNGQWRVVMPAASSTGNRFYRLEAR